ncbi:dihydrolipoyl dehydrogenase, partial [Halalkalibacterium ligniniphilum]|uniref:dihydrolipoyl dehydrogenase n=1 Tax=Halalkalibacterium ligniniphilum TaxID=1134413 RepID=UPI00037CE53B
MVVGDIARWTQVIVIGGGPGGYVAAIRAAQLGKEVTLVEKEDLGGVCLNRGCIPSKAIIHAADQKYKLQQSEVFGLKVTDASFEMNQMMDWKQSIVSKLTNGVNALLKSNKVNVVKGEARFIGKNKIEVMSEESRELFEFEYAIIATGSRPNEIPRFEFDGETVISSTEALQLTDVPNELVVMGGGYIGLELGTAYAKLGAKVTIIELQDQLLPGTDLELIQPVYKNLKKIDVDVFTGTKIKAHEKIGAQMKLVLDTSLGERSITADKLLVSVGRRPNSEQLGLEEIGVEVNEKGFIVTDQQCRTSQFSIFAIGDVATGPMLAHKASKEGIVAAEALSNKASEMDAFAMPAVIFTDPEIATVGLSPDAAKEKGFEITVGKSPFSANGRALSTQQAEGFVQIVVEKESDRVLGVQMVGPDASSLIGEAALAIELGAKAEDISLT